jgi:hypothetical protein
LWYGKNVAVPVTSVGGLSQPLAPISQIEFKAAVHSGQPALKTAGAHCAPKLCLFVCFSFFLFDFAQTLEI